MKKFLTIILALVLLTLTGCKKAEIKGKLLEEVKIDDTYSVKVFPIQESETYKDILGSENAPLNSIFIIIAMEFKNISKEEISGGRFDYDPILISPDNSTYHTDISKTGMLTASLAVKFGIKGSSSLNPGVSTYEGRAFVVPKDQWSKTGWRLRFKKYTDITYK